MKGLSSDEVLQRRQIYGPNILQEKQITSPYQILIRQFKGLIVVLLLVAAGISLFMQQWVECLAILAVIIINSLIGFLTELKATRSMEALRSLGQVQTRVLRDGIIQEVPAKDLVPGDIVILEAGDIVTADLQILESSKLKANESTLTGESLPVSKNTTPVDKNAPLAERSDTLFKGTSITLGSCRGNVIATGMQTELGKISSLVEEAKVEQTPLEQQLEKMGQKLVWLTFLIAGIIILSGVFSGKDLLLMFETAVALAVAAIPEGLPIVATIALARGMLRMAKQNALINRLSAVETLGSTTVIFTDKTGTLTENQMSVEEYQTPENFKDLQLAVKIGALCNSAAINGETSIGDPIEVALLKKAIEYGIDQDSLLKSYPKVSEEAFDPEVRMMATIHNFKQHYFVAVKGAPEAVLDVCHVSEEQKQHWLKRSQQMANKGLRILALAYKEIKQIETPYENLTFVGLVGFWDPPRKDIEIAIQNCQRAGIEVIMVTGDLKETAYSIAKNLGIKKVHYRVEPKRKLELIKEYQKKGEIVAMTGDGVNDAPALKKADIGIAMGLRGTQVAKEASDMVLKDDSFHSIVIAIYQGRVIFTNIRRFVVYLLSCNISEIFIVAIASFINAPLPILPLQILFLNLVTDLFPALALGVGEGQGSYLRNPPRNPKEAIVGKTQWFEIFSYGALITVITLTSFYLSLYKFELTTQKSVTISFLTLGFAQLFHVFNMRDNRSRFLKNDITKNIYIWLAIALCTTLLILAVLIPTLRQVLSLSVPNQQQWVFILSLSLLPFLLGQIFKSMKNFLTSHKNQ